MIGASQYKKNKSIPTIRIISCPNCDKKRLGRYENEDGSVTPASEETVKVRDTDRYLDVCRFCVAKYRKEDEQFVRENMRKLAKSFKDDGPDDKESDHKDFSLN